jgi:hypothetical protein
VPHATQSLLPGRRTVRTIQMCGERASGWGGGSCTQGERGHAPVVMRSDVGGAMPATDANGCMVGRGAVMTPKQQHTARTATTRA